jgi:hypothetical protein
MRNSRKSWLSTCHALTWVIRTLAHCAVQRPAQAKAESGPAEHEEEPLKTGNITAHAPSAFIASTEEVVPLLIRSLTLPDAADIHPPPPYLWCLRREPDHCNRLRMM